VIREHFSCTEWTVADLYILGRNPELLPFVQQIAFGSLLHTVQDSFAAGHTERESIRPGDACPSSELARPARVVRFHEYSQQDGHAHDAEDARHALVRGNTSDWPGAVTASRELVRLNRTGAGWDEVRPILECIFALAPDAKPSGPGEKFIRTLAK
jgi:hypothetical protein